jgi:hypothetical protein
MGMVGVSQASTIFSQSRIWSATAVFAASGLSIALIGIAMSRQ